MYIMLTIYIYIIFIYIYNTSRKDHDFSDFSEDKTNLLVQKRFRSRRVQIPGAGPEWRNATPIFVTSVKSDEAPSSEQHRAAPFDQGHDDLGAILGI